MKRQAACLICIFLLCLMLTGCNDSSEITTPDHNEGMQALADRSYAAKQFSAPLFAEHMASQDISDYTIEKTAYGFFTSESPDSVYVVGYLFSIGGVVDKYGYKIGMDENGNGRVIEEGAHIAGFLFTDGDSEP